MSFKPEFYKSDLPESTPVVLTRAIKKERKKRVLITPFHGGTMEDFLDQQLPANFRIHQDQYAAVIDRVAKFAQVNANQVTPALSAKTVKKIKKDLNDFKTHVVNTNIDFFRAHRTTIYDEGKTALHAIDERLHMDTIPVQSRMNVLQTLTPGLTVCSGAVMTALTVALQTLELDGTGLKGMAYQTKTRMVEALILEHVRANHTYTPNYEVHYVNAYFNAIAPRVGLLPRADPYVRLVQSSVHRSDIDRCEKIVDARLKPEALATAMADDYLSKITNAVVENQGASDLTDPVEGDQLTKLSKICEQVQEVTLNKEFGEVPMGSFLPALDGMQFTHQLASNSIAVAQHFLQELKGQELVAYDKTINLSDKNSPNGTLKMLGTLLWVEKGGICHEAKLADILALSPNEMHRILREQEGMSRADSYAILGNLVRQITQIATQDHTTSVPATWVRELVDLYDQNGRGMYTSPERLMPAKIATAERRPYLKELVKAYFRGKRNIVFSKGATLIDPRWSNPLAMLAIKQGHAAALDVMCSKMLHLNLLDEDGRWFASHAAECGHVNVLEVLKKHGVDLGSPDIGGATPLAYATRMGHVDAVRFLCQSDVEVNASGRDNSTALMHAAWVGNTEVLNVLLEFNAEVNLKNDSGISVLAMAAIRGRGDAVDALIADGADINAVSNTSVSVLMFATGHGHNEVLSKLIAKGASVDTCDNKGHSPLIAAVYARNDSAIEILVRANAKLDVINNAGETALMLAVESNNLSAVAALLAAGADLRIKNRYGYDAAAIAVERNYMEILDRLFAYNA